MSEFLIGETMIIVSRGKSEMAGVRGGKGFWPILWVMLVLLILMGLDANIRSMTTNYKFRVTDVNMALEKLNVRKTKLAAEIESLKNPRRIEKIALKELGLKEPDSARVYGER
ncbi:MAG: hypothetical protein GTO08_12175 [Deltaproteobacteria bacterium]|nr:hypothetical protein [Deltaproteobacteria bacterium]